MLFPIYNVIGTFAENPEVKSSIEMRSLAKDVIDKVTVKEATIDGRPLKEIDRYRIASDVFNVTYPEGNTAGLPPQVSEAVSDGYWIMLEPLKPGGHEIRFKGVNTDFTSIGIISFVTDSTYHLTVSTRPQLMDSELPYLNAINS
jgi:hypothetical protein